MPKIIAFTHRLIPRNRRGSILIMVVAVLVLLALMGTAYISTARLDRQAADVANTATAQDVANQLITSVEDDAKQVILKDIYDSTNGYRPPELDAVTPGASVIPQYDNWDSPIVNNRQNPGSTGYANNPYQQNDAWMAVRLPDELKNTDPSYGTVGRVVTWRAISRPLTDDMTSSAETLFESPYAVPSLIVPGSSYPKWTQSVMPSSADGVVAERVGISDIVISYPTSYPDAAMAGKTRVFPAMFLTNLQGTPLYKDASGKPIKFLAADADGDGIADSGLVPLLPNGGEINGIKFYYAARIIDNNSAINVNTAWSSVGDFQTTNAPVALTNFAFFPGNIDLESLFASYNTGAHTSPEMDSLNYYRFGFSPTTKGGGTAPYLANALTPWEDPPPANAPATNPPINRSTDFIFSDDNAGSTPSQTAAAYFMMSSRMDNPGIRNYVGGNTYRYAPFDWNTSAQIAYRFSMMEPTSDQPVTNPPTPNNITGREPTNLLEEAFLDGGYGNSINGVDSIFSGAANYDVTPSYRFRFFPADMGGYWYRYSLDFDPTATRSSDWSKPSINSVPFLLSGSAPPVPLRAVLTGHDPVSNSIVMHEENGVNVPSEGMLPYNCRGRWSPFAAYAVGDIVIWGDGANWNTWATATTFPPAGTDPTAAYICIGAQTAATAEPNLAAPTYPGPSANWARIVPCGIYNTAHGAYVAGDAVRDGLNVTNNVGPWTVYIALSGTSAPPPGGAWYEAGKPSSNPPKASLNTAPFSELYRAFWNVMVGSIYPSHTPFDGTASPATGLYAAIASAANARPNNTPAGFLAPGTFNSPYVGMKFSDAAPFTANTAGDADGPGVHPAAMFRSPIRAFLPSASAETTFDRTAPRLPADQVALLRSAIAAVNTEDMRDADADVTSRLVHLEGYFGSELNRKPIDAVVYGCEPQLFITEVFADSDPNIGGPSSINPDGYVAIKLYNPYPIPIPLKGYRLLTVDRGTANTSSYMTPILIADFSTVDVTDTSTNLPITSVPAFSYLLVENYNAGGTGIAIQRPTSSGLPTTGSAAVAGVVIDAYCAGLSEVDGSVPNIHGASTVFGQELVVAKTRRFDGTATKSLAVMPSDDLVFDETNPANTSDLVPVDSYDFTGFMPLGQPTRPNTDAQIWYYGRPSGNGASGKAWQYVYPGRYDGTKRENDMLPRHQGTFEVAWDYTSTDPAVLAASWDKSGVPTGATPYLNQDNVVGTLPTPFTIQWANGNFILTGPTYGASIGYNPVSAASPAPPYKFPYGGFMRNGDVLNVPFIGAYRLFDPSIPSPGPNTFEMNAVTMDSAMAEDTIINDDISSSSQMGEDIGRFIPPSDVTAGPTAGTYSWCNHILDYFTAIQNPHDDFMPDIDPTHYPPLTAPARTPGVANAGTNVPANTDLDREPIEGLINVNTAPWKALAALPLVVETTGDVDQTTTDSLAQLIVQYRDSTVPSVSTTPHGPFKNLFELNQVKLTGGQGFQNPSPDSFVTTGSGALQGDFTPVTGGTTGVGVNFDYEWKYANLIRLSNLLTTRSDSYTVYVIVQGWKNTGTITPELVAEKRSAFIVDRSRVNSDNQTLGVYPVPTR